MQKSIAIMAFAALALAGCGDDEPNTQTSAPESAPSASVPETAPPAEQSMQGSAESGATGSDPSVPAAEQVLQPANPANTAQETPANPPDELTKQESSENMPQPGSVHSYSTTVREKTDQTTAE